MVESGRFEILVDGRPIRLGGRVFDVLMALIEVSRAVVSKDDLLSCFWRNRIVDENRQSTQDCRTAHRLSATRELIPMGLPVRQQYPRAIRIRAGGFAQIAMSLSAAAQSWGRRRPAAALIDRQKGIPRALSACPPSVAREAAAYVIDESGDVKVRDWCKHQCCTSADSGLNWPSGVRRPSPEVTNEAWCRGF